jgi:hypothetical protein
MSSERETLKAFFFHAQLTRMIRHISATMLGITWTERWISRGGPIAWPLGRQI